ncbi:MAG TPA: hypothetical protein QF604_25040 [Candidatus Latescibacteria bacterium]|nr:hypothetical protein [Gemmatimonadota bacterium]MDP7363198.1 hypothetical protein [Candidatus Latescibacterota bacterium]MBU09367.1 hypothetical protein [Gemmatimonadota bacterium]MDP7633261.1 hypothetical protein [Candidatus Latescibacterota bacterium]HCV23150.1 hypothetical protein [Candidatus Latescibacterota bacterium]
MVRLSSLARAHGQVVCPLYLRTADSLEAALPDVAGNTVVNAVLNRQISYSDPMAFGEAHQLSVIALRTVEHDGVAIS